MSDVDFLCNGKEGFAEELGVGQGGPGVGGACQQGTDEGRSPGGDRPLSPLAG